MGELKIRKGSFIWKCTFTASKFLLRFYAEIVSGIWAVFVFMPLDNFLNIHLADESTYNLGTGFAIFFTIYTLFFIISSILIPYIKEWIVVSEIEKSLHNGNLTYRQHILIKSVIKKVILYKSFFSLEGFLQFLMTNFYTIGIIFAYFGLEGVVANSVNGKCLIAPIIFLGFFVVVLIIEPMIDGHLAKVIRERNKSEGNISSASRNLLTLILRNLGSGSTLSEDIAQILIEDTIEDIAEILNISTSSSEIKSKKNIKTIKALVERSKKIKTSAKLVKQPGSKKVAKVVKKTSKRKAKKSK